MTKVLGLPCTCCNKAGFYLKSKPVIDDPIKASNNFNHHQFSQPVAGEAIKCQWCGGMLEFSVGSVQEYDYETGTKVATS